MEKIETILPYAGLECILGNSWLSEGMYTFRFCFRFQVCQNFYFASVGIWRHSWSLCLEPANICFIQPLAYGLVTVVKRQKSGANSTLVFPSWKYDDQNWNRVLCTICVLVLHDADRHRSAQTVLDTVTKISKCLAFIQDATFYIYLLLGQEKQMRNRAQKVGRNREVTKTRKWEDERMCMARSFLFQLRENRYFHRSFCFPEAPSYVPASIRCYCHACFPLPPAIPFSHPLTKRCRECK